jgi:hypothetical protein
MQALHSQGKLNRSQALAITGSITRSVSLWQGPPGTGKTNTLVGLIQVRWAVHLLAVSSLLCACAITYQVVMDMTGPRAIHDCAFCCLWQDPDASAVAKVCLAHFSAACICS